MEYRIEFQKYVNSYLNDYVRFADQKAGIIFAIFGGILFLLAGKFQVAISDLKSFSKVFLIGASLLSAVATEILAIATVFPRTPKKRKKGFIFWENIVAFDQDEYLKGIANINQEAILAELSYQNYNIAHIAQRKYSLLKWGIGIGVISLFLSILSLALF